MNIYKINFGETSGYGVGFIKAKSQIEILDILRLAEYPTEYLEDLEINKVTLDPIPNLNGKGDLDYTWEYIKDEFKIEPIGYGWNKGRLNIQYLWEK